MDFVPSLQIGSALYIVRDCLRRLMAQDVAWVSLVTYRFDQQSLRARVLLPGYKEIVGRLESRYRLLRLPSL